MDGWDVRTNTHNTKEEKETKEKESERENMYKTS